VEKVPFKKNEWSLIKSKIKWCAPHNTTLKGRGKWEERVKMEGVCYLCWVNKTPMLCVYRNKQEMNGDSLSRFIICFFQQTILTFNVIVLCCDFFHLWNTEMKYV